MKHLPKFTPYQKFVVALLSFLQFTIVLDFMIVSPLGAVLMPALKITPSQFGLVVSAYAFSAGAAGLLSAGFADRYDRKKILLFFYLGFLIGTLLCGLSPSYEFLLFARMITGLFGGVIGSISLAIITDIFSFDLRGRVMGFVQTSFAASQILGIPAGLFFSNRWGWHAPFIMIVAIGFIAGLLMWIFLRPITGHLSVRPKGESAFHHLKETFQQTQYLLAFASTALLSVGGFMLMPFGSAYTVNNLGIELTRLPMVYLVTGTCTIFLGPLVGLISDKYGKFKTFIGGTFLTIIMVLIYTNLGVTPLYQVILVNVILFAGIFSRLIPSQALMTAIPAPEHRGSFMSISSSLQQIAGGVASVIAGMVVMQAADGKIEHFDILGYILVGTGLTALVFMYFINQSVEKKRKLLS